MDPETKTMSREEAELALRIADVEETSQLSDYMLQAYHAFSAAYTRLGQAGNLTPHMILTCYVFGELFDNLANSLPEGKEEKVELAIDPVELAAQAARDVDLAPDKPAYPPPPKKHQPKLDNGFAGSDFGDFDEMERGSPLTFWSPKRNCPYPGTFHGVAKNGYISIACDYSKAPITCHPSKVHIPDFQSELDPSATMAVN